MYVLLHTWEHENGHGTKVIAINEDKSSLQELMCKEAQNLKSMIHMPSGILWEPILIEHQNDSIRVGYNLGIPSVWRWEIQEVDVLANDSEG